MKVGIVTIGGDCSGLNSVIYGSYLFCKNNSHEMVGFIGGVKGLVNNDVIKLDSHVCDELLLSRSGSILRTDNKYIHTLIKSNKTIEQISHEIYNTYRSNILDGLIYIGGDGSMSLLMYLMKYCDNNMNIIAVPKTIDNDVRYTDIAIGFDTAVQSVVSSIDQIRTTMMSHSRVAVIEVMGRDAGFLAMRAGVASGADVILVPEFDYSFDSVMEKVQQCYSSGKNYCIIVVAEAVESNDLKHDCTDPEGSNLHTRNKYNGIGSHLASRIKNNGYDTKSVVLGHTQRGGTTTPLDRIIGISFGSIAAQMISSGETNKVLSIHNGKITTVSLGELGETDFKKKLSNLDNLVKICKNIGIYCGNC